MINYSLQYSISEVAKILQIDTSIIKKWIYHFSEYLSSNANPPKGTVRKFSVNDLCTLSYISMYWEEKPDFENIKCGLNSNSQFEYPFSEIATESTPIFREFSEDLIVGQTFLIVGIADFDDKISLADSYKLAGDVLLLQAIENEDDKLIFPTIYNYRHATELYLKALIPTINNLPKNGMVHSLDTLYNAVKQILEEQFKTVPPKWFENFILAFNDFDPNGTSFRYGISFKKDEYLIDLYHLKKMMNLFSESIHNVKNEMRK